MMKKMIFVTIVILCLWILPLPGDEPGGPMTAAEGQQSAPPEKSAAEAEVTKTYTLRYVSPDFVRETLRIYFKNSSYSPGSNLITIAIPKGNLAAFEEQLRKIDVERRTVTLRIFTVIASKESKSWSVENRDLRRVLDDVSQLLNFKSFVLDGASSISASDGTNRGRLLLSSSLAESLRFDFARLAVSTSSSGKRSVKLEMDLVQSANNQNTTLIESTTEIAENGYLVAGVSRIGADGRSLILVINAEIK